MKPETKLKRILAKERLTGKDIGETLLLDIAINLNRREKGQQLQPPTFSPEDIDQLTESLTDKEKLDYNLYVCLHNALVKGANNEALYASQFFHAYYKLQGYLKDIIAFEEIYKDLSSRPLIVTRPAYENLFKEAAAARANKMVSYTDLLFYTLEYFLKCDQQPLLIPPTIRAELEALKEAPIPQPPPEAAEPSRPEKEIIKKGVDAAKLIYDGKEAIIARLNSAHFATEPLKAMTENEVIDYITRLGGLNFLIDTEAILKNNAAKNPPRTKYGVLIRHVGAYKDAVDINMKRSRLNVFKREYAALYKAIDAYMQAKLPALVGLKPNQQLKPLFKANDLTGTKADYEPIKQTFLNGELTIKDIARLFDETTPAGQLKRKQVESGGISIAEHIMPEARTRFDNKGVYSADIERLDPECIDTLKDDQSDILNDIIYQQEWLITPIRKIFAYNVYLKAALTGLNIEYLDAAFIGMNTIEIAQSNYNNTLYLAYSGIPGTPTERAERRAAIKKAFQPLDIDSLRASQKLEMQVIEIAQEFKKGGKLIEFYRGFEELAEQIAGTMSTEGAGLYE